MFVFLSFILLPGCNRDKMDKDIKADIAVKSKTEVDFAGVQFIVDKGIVILTGLCASNKAKDNVEVTVKNIAGVKDVKNNIVVGPVVIDQDFPLKQSVDCVLMKYNMVQASVDNGGVIVTGKLPEKELSKLLESLNNLPVSKIENRLTVQ